MQFPRVGGSSRDFTETPCERPRIRGWNIPPRAPGLPFPPNPDISGEIRVNGVGPTSGAPVTVSGVRRGVSRFPEYPTSSPADQGFHISPHPHRAWPVAPNSDRSREIRVNGEDPPREGHLTVPEIRRVMSRFPEYHTRRPRIRRVAYFTHRAAQAAFFAEFRQIVRNQSKWHKTTDRGDLEEFLRFAGASRDFLNNLCDRTLINGGSHISPTAASRDRRRRVPPDPKKSE